MSRPINFCSGPAALPLPVLDRISAELHDFQGSKISVMEHSHRDQVIVRLFEDTEARLKALLGVGEAYRVLFLPGGATLQFSQVPMNLLDGNGTAAYLTTGAWSQKAIKEAVEVWSRCRSCLLQRIKFHDHTSARIMAVAGRCKIFSSVY